MKPKHSDSDVGWIKREFAKVRREMAQDRAAKRAQATTIGKGGLNVVAGGSISSTYPNGAKAARFGPYLPDGGGETGYGFFLDSEDGEELFGAVRYPDSNLSGLAVQNMDSVVIAAASTLIARDDFLATIGLDAGGIALNGGAQGVFITHSTTGASANAFLDPSDKRIWRSTSSRRYKQDIEDATVDPSDVMQLVGRTWRDKGQVETNPDETTRYTGFIAEELDELPSLRQFVIYDDQGRPDAIAYDRLSVAILSVLKSFDSRLTALEQAATEH